MSDERRIFQWVSRLSPDDERVIDRAAEVGHFDDLVDRWSNVPDGVREEGGAILPSEAIKALAEAMIDRAEALLGRATHGSRWAICARLLDSAWPRDWEVWIRSFVDALARHLEKLP